MRYTKAKYDKKGSINYSSSEDISLITNQLGLYEDVMEKYKVDSLQDLERLIILGSNEYARVKLAMGHKVYFISGNKKRKAILVGYADQGNSLDSVIIRKKKEEVEIPYTHLFISSRECKRARKYRQIYKLNKEQFRRIFGTRLFKQMYLLETVRGTDEFIIVSKPYKTYFKKIVDDTFTLESLKSKYSIDVESEFSDKRKKYKERTKYLKTKWI